MAEILLLVTKKGLNNLLRWRLVGAVAIIVPVVGLLWLDENYNGGCPGAWFALLAMFVALCCLQELTQLLQPIGRAAIRLRTLTILSAGMAAMLVATLSKLWPTNDPNCPLGNWGWPMLGLVIATAIIMSDELVRFQPGTGVTDRIAKSLLTIYYVVVPYFFIFHLRMIWADRRGLLALVSIVFVAKMADAGAYFGGRYFGKNKMAPILSPKKTVEGGVAGLLTAIAAAMFFVRTMMPWFLSNQRMEGEVALGADALWWALMGFGISIGLSGMIGDLSISLFKRDAGQKDSASWLPGLGGFLDVMDSVIWAAPVGYLWWISGRLGG